MSNIYTYLEKLQRNYFNLLVILFIWCSLFLSLNTNFVTIFVLFENFNITNLLKARPIFIIISFFLIIFLIFKKKIILRNNLFYFLLLMILAIQSTYFFSNDFDLIKEISFINIYEKNLFSDRNYGIQLQAIQLFLSIFISLFLILIFNEKKNEPAFILSFLFFLAVFCIFYFSLLLASLPSHLQSKNILFYYNSFFAHNSQILQGEPAIRVTGIARSLLIISLILLCIFLSLKKKLQFKLPLMILVIFINTSIIMMGSRFATYSLFLTYTFLIIFLEMKFFNKIKFFIIFLFFPIILFFITGNLISKFQINEKIKLLKLENNNYQNKNLNELVEILEKRNSVKKDSRYIENIKNTSGRVQIWVNAFEISKERGNHFFGNGINADRRLLVKYGNEFGTNASNGFINIYLTSGMIGLFLFILANLIILMKIYNFIFIHKCFSNFKEYYLINLSILILIVFYQRTIFENSFTSFGVDYLIYLVCCYFILNKINCINLK